MILYTKIQKKMTAEWTPDLRLKPEPGNEMIQRIIEFIQKQILYKEESYTMVNNIITLHTIHISTLYK